MPSNHTAHLLEHLDDNGHPAEHTGHLTKISTSLLARIDGHLRPQPFSSFWLRLNNGLRPH
jgi:hypothetical protein